MRRTSSDKAYLLRDQNSSSDLDGDADEDYNEECRKHNSFSAIQRRARCNGHKSWWMILSSCLFLGSAILCLGTVLLIRRSQADFPQVWSPIWDAVRYETVTFDAEIGSPSVFKGFPNKVLDKAWDDLSDKPMILVDEHGMQAMNQSMETAKGKDGKYYGLVEVYHQLHCLNLIRKYIWRDNYKDDISFDAPEDALWDHVDHCIDLLRQVLMCHADVGLIVFTDVGRGRQPVPRFNNLHTCRDLSAITEWVERHNADPGTPRR